MIVREFVLTDAQRINGNRDNTSPVNTRTVANDTASGSIGIGLNYCEFINDTSVRVQVEVSESTVVFILPPFARASYDLPPNGGRRYRVTSMP
jgi:hypothetical protein